MKVIKIGAVWCPGCLVMRPRWREIEDEYLWLKTEYFDFDQDTEKIKQYNVDSKILPLFIFIDKDGKELTRLEGEPSKKEIVELILKYQNS